MKRSIGVILLIVAIGHSAFCQNPVKIGIAGLSHSHVVPLLRNIERNDLKVVGIYESDKELVDRYTGQFNLNREIIFDSLDEMLEKTKPDGVVTFTSIYDHLMVVEACAPRGIHVMVEKPLAVSNKHAKKMSALASKHGILVLTNYETTWYPSIYKSFDMVKEGQVGELRKVIVYDGHKGPEEIRVNKEFLAWLTDPVLNGGGAVIDFGCYGANLMTWLMNGLTPESVYASLKRYKPDVYPKVDDDATLLLSYPGLEAVINASWNWPFNRKDMHIYGNTGYIFCDDAQNIRYKLDEKSPERSEKVPLQASPFRDGFAFFAAAIRGETVVKPNDLSSLENNVTVVAILEAAKKSSRTGKSVILK
jgi:predicted dehydrogenase